MLCSMTAFAQQETNTPSGTLSWEIKTVNHRYLEPSFKIPEPFRSAESHLRKVLRSKLQRGKIDANLRFKHDSVELARIAIDDTRLQQLLHATRHINALVGQDEKQATLDALTLLAWPGVIAENTFDASTLLNEAITLFAATIDDVLTTRRREGAELARLVEHRLDSMLEIILAVRKDLPAELQRQRDKLSSKVADLQQNCDPLRLEQELVFLTQKSDTSEELDRLETHITEVRRVLHKGEACGRRLDFLMQELNREANTLSAKAISSTLTQYAVDLKVLIEQMREQVQNIE